MAIRIAATMSWLRRPILSAIRPESTMPMAPTAAPATWTHRNSAADWPPVSVTQLKGKIVTRWNIAKLASGTKAPSTTSMACLLSISKIGRACSSCASMAAPNSLLATMRRRAKSATTLIAKATKKG